jgi:hypothetical protein
MIAGLARERPEGSVCRDGAGEASGRVPVAVWGSHEEADGIPADARRKQSFDGVVGRRLVLV